MRKISLYLVFIFIITSCDNKEELTSKTKSLNNPMQLYIINGSIEYYSEITDGSKPKPPIFVYDIPDKTEEANNLTSKSEENSVSINFASGVGSSTKSGCTVKRYNNGNSYYTDAGVFGSIPYAYPYPETKSYLIRGYGSPHLNPSYGSLVLTASNKGRKSIGRTGEVWHDNNQSGSAISIEYNFKANVTYEISIKVSFYDNRFSIDKAYSDGRPTIFMQLKDDGIIEILNDRHQQDPCESKGINSVIGYGNSHINNTRSYTLDGQSLAVVQKTLVFKFSTTEEKKALLISLHPSTSIPGYGAPISTNDYSMTMPLINIVEKPFDSSLNVNFPEPTPGRR
ncbi:hypothetical protein [Flavobacterium aquidurense]|uniref:Lipoprotein n=1 Tax=Flavobacterium aquidurense TaxID=362413 RepID=A0A0N8VLW0_9FLAO|nr:hypothetical protein [Flavobacterium aquidurense]KQB37620.1 hypothetical protein RC62_2786 [Flavobacterium aquidurense]